MQITWYYIQKALKSPHKKLLELINEFSKVAGYKINVQKLVVLLYTNNANVKIIHFKIAWSLLYRVK